jgi:hypothetical protein
MRKMNRTRRYRGGGLGNGYTFGAPIVSNLDAGQTVVPQSSCMAEVRPGYISNPGTASGLPGMGGGGKRSKRTKRQRGGRYGFDLSASANFGGTPWGSGIPQVMSIPCESARANPLNAVQMGGVGGVDSAFYSAPTAGYTNTPSTWVGTTGAPSLLQTPYDARTLNPACLKTGGARRSRRRSRGKKSRGKKSRGRK